MKNKSTIGHRIFETKNGKFHMLRNLTKNAESEVIRFTSEMELPSYLINDALYVHDDMFMILVLHFSQDYDFIEQ